MEKKIKNRCFHFSPHNKTIEREREVAVPVVVATTITLLNLLIILPR